MNENTNGNKFWNYESAMEINFWNYEFVMEINFGTMNQNTIMEIKLYIIVKDTIMAKDTKGCILLRCMILYGGV